MSRGALGVGSGGRGGGELKVKVEEDWVGWPRRSDCFTCFATLGAAPKARASSDVPFCNKQLWLVAKMFNQQ